LLARPYKILIVDDEASNIDILRTFLSRREEFHVLTARNGVEALEVFQEEKDVSLILLDIMMPEMDGWEVLRAVRGESAVPVIMITARDEVSDIVQAFTLGVDDYINKPFKLPEVEVRVEAVLRRAHRSTETETVLTAGPLVVNEATKTVELDGQALDLSPKEFELARLFAEKPGTVISAEEIVQRLWPNRHLADAHDVKQIIYLLRKKLEPNPEHPELLVTVRGFGYKFVT